MGQRTVLGTRLFFIGRIRRSWNYLLRDDDDVEHLLDSKRKRYIPVERLQLPLSSAHVFTDYGLQGQTVESICLDLKRPAGMSRDEHWLALFVLLSRTTTLDSVLIYRLCRREHFAGGPPDNILQELKRLKVLQRKTFERLDETLKSLGLQHLRDTVTLPLLETFASRPCRPRSVLSITPSSVEEQTTESPKRRRLRFKTKPNGG